MNEELQKEVFKLMKCFHKSFINSSQELILEARNNVYFRLEDVKTVLDLKCKLIAWVSRPASKDTPKLCRLKLITGFNKYLGTNFSQEEILDWIYTLLGNDCNRELCEKFVESNYDLSVLKSYKARRQTACSLR